ncbi:hypothetical protein PHLGIDRAFT_113885 [Phlebiopsis gigantea 11061_1 CR5-6]|uniref:Major facilitator superfamily (MFS) profile domain-containing protein n=1 Tax=Phlebiopsis gigantea (strain 11061_1 CR5-6) TaxID=745531 RepID=A0A0C3P2G2_PHLG1|nr:hypothetical protein PHLGIDRAFT_113885 [Phlebiopsis gigantea 11061_1 CR5-6]
MSSTKVYTDTREDRAAPTGSLSLRGRSPHPLQDGNGARKSFEKGGDIELAQLGVIADGAQSGQPSTGKTSPSPVFDPAHPSAEEKWKARIQLAACCSTLFLAGWNDGTTGPLLPRIQANYHVGYTVVSLIFIFNCLGFVSGAAANVHLTDKFGFGKVMVLGSVAQCVGYALDAPAPPFPVMVLAFAINGFGIALQDAGANGFVASMKDNAQVKMGVLHAVYGAGALCAPLAATKFSTMPHWSYQYLTSLGIAVLNTVFLILAFNFKTQDVCLAESGQTIIHTTAANHEDSKYRQIFRLREVHLLALFIFIYVGVEVTLGGWTVTYLQKDRGGGSATGYVSAGFFGGLMLGRVGLLWVNQKLGERTAIYVYTVLAIALELVVWLVPSLIGGSVAVSFVGVLLGPVYPIVMNHSARILPHWLLTGSIGWIAGFGQAGSAFLPFLTGVIAGKAGIWALQPLIVAMMTVMLVLWFLVPNASRRVD